MLKVKVRKSVKNVVARAAEVAMAKRKKLSTGKRRMVTPLAEVNRRFDFGTAGRMSSKYWDFSRNGLSVSGIGKWLQCKEQFRLSYVEGWEGGGYSFAIEFGSVFHWLHEQMVNSKNGHAFCDVTSYRKKWLNEHPTSSPKQREDQEVIYAMAAGVWPGYAYRYQEDRAREWVCAEREFDIPIVLPDGRKTSLHGYMDGVWRDDGLWLHEMKTKSRIDTGQIEDTLWLDMQVMTYLIVLTMEYPADHVSGVDYDVIRRPGTMPHKKETLKQYTGRLVELVDKDPTYYFWRVKLEVGKKDITNFRDAVLFPVLTDIADWAERKRPHYPTPEALVGKYGPCDMYNAITLRNFTSLRRKS